MKKSHFSLTKLRQNAKTKLNQQLKFPTSKPKKNQSSHDLQREHEELQLHQIEVEIQNSELLESRARIEELLKNFTELYDHTPVAYFTLSHQGKILQMSLRAENILGGKRSTLIGQLFGNFILPSLQKKFSILLNSVIAGIRETSEEFIILLKSKNQISIRIVAQCSIPGKECRLIVTDISERKLIEERLRLTNTAISSSGDAISIINFQGIVEYINPAFTQITGYSEKEIVGKKSNILKSGANKKKVFHEVWKTILAGKVWRGELIHRHKNGNLYMTEQTISPVLNEVKEVTHFVSIKKDITERRQAEISKQKVDELAAFNAKLEEEILRKNKEEEILRKNDLEKSVMLLQSLRMQDELRELSRQVITIQEEERQKISRELHDVIAQTLAGIQLRLAALAKKGMKEVNSLDLSITETQQQLEKSVEIVQRFARDLRPSVLDDLGLIPALRFFVKQFSKRTGIKIQLTLFAKIENLKMDHRTVLFRIAQEALNNVARHAQATQVNLKLFPVPQGISLVIHDNGKSFNVDRVLNAKQIKHLGLLGMRERIGMVGGTFAIKSIPRQGTKIAVVVPFLKESKK